MPHDIDTRGRHRFENGLRFDWYIKHHLRLSSRPVAIDVDRGKMYDIPNFRFHVSWILYWVESRGKLIGIGGSASVEGVQLISNPMIATFSTAFGSHSITAPSTSNLRR